MDFVVRKRGLEESKSPREAIRKRPVNMVSHGVLRESNGGHYQEREVREVNQFRKNLFLRDLYSPASSNHMPQSQSTTSPNTKNKQWLDDEYCRIYRQHNSSNVFELDGNTNMDIVHNE